MQFRFPDLDHNAGAPLDPRVDEALRELGPVADGNPHAAHERGRAARGVLEAARERIAAVVGRRPDEVVFCSGGTEANNIAVATGARLARARRLPFVVSPIEHPSVAMPVSDLRGDARLDVRVLDIEADPRFALVLPREAVAFVTCIVAQGEVGTLQDLPQLRAGIDAACASAGAPRPVLHSDASQGLGRVDLAAALEVADLVTLSPHKVGGPRGIGVLLAREGLSLAAVLRGGAQELGRRPGTQSPRLAHGAALAIELARVEWQERAATMRANLDAFLSGLAAHRAEGAVQVIGEDRLACSPHALLPNTRSLLCPRVDARVLLPALDVQGIGVSHGSACSSGASEPSSLLVSLGLTPAEARSTLRVSVGAHPENEKLRHAGGLFSQVLGAFGGEGRRKTR